MSDLKVIVCNYSGSCDRNCEKCPRLTQLKIVDLATLKPEQRTEQRCGCD